MAQRPIFIPNFTNKKYVKQINIEFEWHPGYSIQQKQKSIMSLHEEAKKKGTGPILEISTKSEKELGKQLSAFNLLIKLSNGNEITVEAAYQGSKVFEKGGPYKDFFNMQGREIKRDDRLYNSGELIGFDFNGVKWGLMPKTAFYDWLYINALYQNPILSEQLLQFSGFSDIEFNPIKSISCQASAAALYVSLYKQNLLEKVIFDKSKYLELMGYNVESQMDISAFSNENTSNSNSLDKLFPLLNKWRFLIKKADTLPVSNSTVTEFIQTYPQYSGMEDEIIKEIEQGNSNCWFSYDYCDSTINEIYAQVEEYIRSLGTDIKIKNNKTYVSFQRKKTIISVVLIPRNGTVVLYLKLNPDDVLLENGFSRNVTNRRHKGVGNLEITLKSIKDLEDSKYLLAECYKLNS